MLVQDAHTSTPFAHMSAFQVLEKIIKSVTEIRADVQIVRTWQHHHAN